MSTIDVSTEEKDQSETNMQAADSSETSNVVDATQSVPEGFHTVKCYLCQEEVTVASHLQLPHHCNITSVQGSHSKMEKLVDISKKNLREHCLEKGHAMLWEVGVRSDFVSDESVIASFDTAGPAGFLVQTLLSDSFFPAFTDLYGTFGCLRVVVALTTWQTAVAISDVCNDTYELISRERKICVMTVSKVIQSLKNDAIAFAGVNPGTTLLDAATIREWCERAVTAHIAAEHQAKLTDLLTSKLWAGSACDC